MWSLEPSNTREENLWDQILCDVDLISDYRVMRFDAAIQEPPLYVYVMLVGLLLTIAGFGAYSPQTPAVIFISLYAGFVGLVLYLILALSDPFQGDIGAGPDTFGRIAMIMQDPDMQ